MTPVGRANDAWREGRILEAQRQYQAIIRTDPNVWGALFQLAWLDGIFGKLTAERVRALERPGLSESARNIIKALEGMVSDPMPLVGSMADWDIESLRQQGGGETYSSWWEAHGKAAAKAGLYGVALACLEEAESREPNGAYWDPPWWTHSLPALVEGHLELVVHPFEPRISSDC
jgi:tetratricopeptide (TPR) repeat protein